MGGRSRDRRCWWISRRRTSLWSCSLLLCLSSPQRCDGGFDLARRLPCASARARPWTRSAGHRHCAWPTSVQPCRVRALTTYIDGVGLGHGVALILFVRCMSVGEGSEGAHFAPLSGDGACGACRSEPGHRFAQRFDQSGRPCGAARAPGSSGRRTGCFGNDGGDIGAEPPTRASRPAPPLGRGPWEKLTN